MMVPITENWRRVVNFPAYDVSDLGRVRRITPSRRGPPGILKATCDAAGYPAVALYEGGKRKRFRIHRLVALTFLGLPPHPKDDVAHWDGDRGNPKLSNLRWATRSENNADKIRHGRHNAGERHCNCKITSAQAEEILKLRAGGMLLREIAVRYGVARETIGRIVSGKRAAPSPVPEVREFARGMA